MRRNSGQKRLSDTATGAGNGVALRRNQCVALSPVAVEAGNGVADEEAERLGRAHLVVGHHVQITATGNRGEVGFGDRDRALKQTFVPPLAVPSSLTRGMRRRSHRDRRALRRPDRRLGHSGLRDNGGPARHAQGLHQGVRQPRRGVELNTESGIAAKLDAEEWRDLVGGYLEAASAAVVEMGGKVAKKLGDRLTALFGYPLAQENNAERTAQPNSLNLKLAS